MPSTRTRIIQYLKVNPDSAAAEIGQALSMSAANIRHHLHVLDQAGLVEFTKFLPPNGRSHPIYRYHLTSRSQLNNLDILADILLQELSMRSTSVDFDLLLHSVANHLMNRMDFHSTANRHLTPRLTETVLCLNEFNYQSRWEARSPSPLFIFGHCPYFIILDRHPEMCQMDQFLLEKLIQTPVKQSAQVGKGSPPSPICSFAINC